MKRWMKISLGICCHWFFLVVLIGFVASLMTKDQLQSAGAPYPLGAAAFLAFRVFTLAIWIGTIVLVAKHAMRHPRIDGNMRILWVFLLVVCLVGMPVYFWMHIWPQPVGEPFFGIKETA